MAFINSNSLVVGTTLLLLGYAIGHLLNGFAYTMGNISRTLWPFKVRKTRGRSRIQQVFAPNEQAEKLMLASAVQAMPPTLRAWVQSGGRSHDSGYLWGIIRPFVMSRNLENFSKEIERYRSVVSLSFGMRQCGSLLCSLIIIKWVALLVLSPFLDPGVIDQPELHIALFDTCFFAASVFVYYASDSRYSTHEGSLRRDVILATHLSQVTEFEYES